MKQHLYLRQSVTINRNLQNLLQLLQWSNQDLSMYIVSQVESNPLLQFNEQRTEILSTEYQSDIPFDNDDCYENMWGNTSYIYKDSTAEIVSEVQNLQTLESSLRNQIKIQFSKDIQEKALMMLEYIDDAGYLCQHPNFIADDLNLSLVDLQHILKNLQQLEPVGVFARSLKECLQLQLIDQDIYDQNWDVLLNHLEWIAQDQYKKLFRSMKKRGIAENIVLEMVQHLKTLNPKPGSIFSQDHNFSIIPDFLIKYTKEGWTAKINPRNSLKVSFDSEYYEELKKCSVNHAAQQYVKQHYTHGRALIHSIAQRDATLEKIVKEIIEQQKDFLQYGPRYLKSLILKDIAQSVGMHESTISRSTQNKYIATPQGIYSLKYFFSSKIKGIFSPESVKAALQQIINSENTVCSDEQLVKLLEEYKGIVISRRTVAHYRRILKVPTSFKRRKIKNSVISQQK